MRKIQFARPLISVLIFLLFIINAFSQKVTLNPRVDNGCSDETSTSRITSIITSTEYTFVTFQHTTTLFKPWLMINSKTLLKTNLSEAEFKILEWGLITEDDNEPFASLRLNEQYSIKRRIAYNFYMVFPAIPENTTIIDIIVPAQNLEGERGGFYWKGIHINNETTEDLSKDKPNYPKNDGFTPNGSGSGFAINSNGYIATCYHVIADARGIRVKGVDGNFQTALNAKVVASDEKNDLAILKIDDARFLQLPYSFATSLSDVGEDIFILGYPQTQHLGEELKLTTGVISSRSGYRGDITTYQISAQALPGNSGCPLFDNAGNVIGVVSAKYIEPNVSYAVKLAYLKMLIENSKISLTQPVSSSITGKTLAEKVKSVRNFIYIIEIEK